MDIFRISNLLPPSYVGRAGKAKENTDRDPQGEAGSGYHREPPADQEEAEAAAGKLRDNEGFSDSGLDVDVRELDGSYFLDIYDPTRRKIKTINAAGIRAILKSDAAAASGNNTRLLDRRV